MQASIRERANGYADGRTEAPPPILGTRREWLRDIALSTAVGMLLGLAGPFGSYLNGPWPVRVFYWVAALWIGLALQGVAHRLAIAAARRWRLGPALGPILATPLAAVPVAVLCRLLAEMLWPDIIPRVDRLEWYAQTCLVCALFTVGYTLVHAWPVQSRGSLAETPAASCSPSFVDRLPPDLGRDLLALQMEDHYVRTHTARGSALLLMPLHRAIEELGDLQGLRVHRSWWVARHAVADCVRDGRNVRLRLSNGLHAPVARASVAALKAASFPGADRL